MADINEKNAELSIDDLEKITGGIGTESIITSYCEKCGKNTKSRFASGGREFCSECNSPK